MSDVLEKQAPLEDLMAAMDVVDTLRHERDIAVRELDGEGRQERLLARLRELYQAQGIDVPEHVLQEGIDALEQERFQYQPVAPSWSTKLAKIWVTRGRWGKPMGFLAVVASMFSGVYFVTDVLPEKQQQAALEKAIAAMPAQLDASMSTIRIIAKNPDVIREAESKVLSAKQAIANQEFSNAEQVLRNVKAVAGDLQQEYSIRVVSRPGESSGIWRVPDVNESGKNYYLIVEAVDAKNNVVELNVLSEESNIRKKVKTWGLRVNQQTFQRVATDKQDDGIIQSNRVGKKQIGYLLPQFSIPTTGATITEW